MTRPLTTNRREILRGAAAAAITVLGTGSTESWTNVSASAEPLPPAPEILASRQLSPRTTININRDWKFTLGDHPGAQAADFSDQQWDAVGLPHSFSLPYFRGTDFYVGYGWYRKRIHIPDPWHGKCIAIEFEATFQHAEVYFNGNHVGSHQGGFTSFSCDVTKWVQPGENLLAVRLNNLWNPELAPRAGDHIFDGGLYRNVFLVVTNPVHIAFQGITVTTPRVSERSAEVRIDARVLNSTVAEKRCTLVSKIMDPDGQIVATLRTTRTIPAGAEHLFIQTSEALPNPKLWHPDHPRLYSVKIQVMDGEMAMDAAVAPLGFRWFKWTAEQGFFLNGRHLWIQGANVHQDHAGWASGITDAGAWRDVRMVKEAGFNFIRTSHYPHSRAFMEACDYYGILIWSEMCFWGVGGFGPDGNWRASAYPVEPEHWAGFENSCLQQLEEMIAMHRNHPCIVTWSMCNEVFFTNAKVFGRMKRLLVHMVRRSHELDPTRPAAIGGAQRGGVDKLGDIAGYNGDGATLYINPGFPNLVTEYGSVVANRPGPYSPDFGLLQPKHFPWRSGAAIWCGFDYGTWVGVTGKMGIIDYFRLPKRAWYWYRNSFAHARPPTWRTAGKAARLHLQADRTIIHGTDATEDSHVILTVLDQAGRPVNNSPPVELTIESGPGEFPTGRGITFSPRSAIWIGDGQAAIEFRSYHAGVSVLRARSPGLETAILRITTTGTPVYIPGQTPVVKPRPYIATPQPNQNTYKMSTVGKINIALNRPTTASSSRHANPSRYVDDGKPSTCWLAEHNVPGQWCQIDLEGEFTISQVNVTFPESGVYKCAIMVSPEGTHWQHSDVLLQSTSGRACGHTFTAPAYGRFVRVVLEQVPSGAEFGIAEISVYGHHGR